MNQKSLFALWGCLFSLCAGLGFIPEPSDSLRLFLCVLSLLFFLPPALLLYSASKKKDQNTIKLIRNLSALSLSASLVILILNFLSVFFSEALGTILHYMLIIVTSPMICSGSWVLSLFLWACLLMTSVKELKGNACFFP